MKFSRITYKKNNSTLITMNSRIVFAVACLGLANAVKLFKGEMDDVQLPVMSGDIDDMQGDVEGELDEEIDMSGAYWTGEYGDFTAGDGTRFVTGAEEEDDSTKIENDDGMVA